MKKLGIISYPELAKAEERLSDKKAAEAFENSLPDTLEAGIFASLKAVYKYLLDEL